MTLLDGLKMLKSYMELNLMGLDDEYFQELWELENEKNIYKEQIQNLTNVLSEVNVKELRRVKKEKKLCKEMIRDLRRVLNEVNVADMIHVLDERIFRLEEYEYEEDEEEHEEDAVEEDDLRSS